MKKLSIAIILLSGTYLLSSCNGDNKSTASTTTDSVATTSGMADTAMNNTAAMDTMNAKKDTMTSGTAMIDANTKDFVTKAATGGMMEVDLGKMAAEKGKSQQVKDFGQMMVDDHSKANDKLKSLASQKSIMVPASVTEEQKMEMDKLSKKTGRDFDKAYVDMMVDDHKKDIADFKKASGNVGDNDIKNFATTTLPTLQKHLDAIQGIKSKM